MAKSRPRHGSGVASIERPGLASFITLRLPREARGAFRKTGIVLTILGSIQLVLMALTIVVWGAILAGSIFFWMAVKLTAAPISTTPFTSGVWIFLMILALGLVFLYWNSWIYAKWIGRDSRAPIHTMAFSIITILGILTLPLRDPLSMLLVVAKVVLAIVLLVISRRPEAKEWFKIHQGEFARMTADSG